VRSWLDSEQQQRQQQQGQRLKEKKKKKCRKRCMHVAVKKRVVSAATEVGNWLRRHSEQSTTFAIHVQLTS
jgi:hypothetical protein